MPQLRFVPAALALALVVMPALAQVPPAGPVTPATPIAPGAPTAPTAQGDKDNLIALYRIGAMSELCDAFEMSDAEEEALSNASDLLQQKVALTDAEADALYEKTKKELEPKRAEGLCDPKGDSAKLYRQTLEGLVKK